MFGIAQESGLWVPRDRKSWYLEISSTLKKLGFRPNPADPCVFNSIVVIDGVEKQCTIVVYVDDLMVTCIYQQVIDDIIQKLQIWYNEKVDRKDRQLSWDELGFFSR